MEIKGGEGKEWEGMGPYQVWREIDAPCAVVNMNA